MDTTTTANADLSDLLEALKVETPREAMAEIARLITSDLNNASWATEREAVRAVVFYRGDTLTDAVSSLRSMHDRHKSEHLLASTRMVESRRKCAELETALSATQLAERTRILSMLERFASGYDDSGDTAEAEVTRSLARAIEQGQHWTQDGDAFVAIEVAS